MIRDDDDDIGWDAPERWEGEEDDFDLDDEYDDDLDDDEWPGNEAA